MKMWNKFKSLFNSSPIIRFACTVGGYYVATPPVEARRCFPEWLKGQIKDKKVKYSSCPGMWDICQHGYIIKAWADIHIKANSVGVVVKVDAKDQQLGYSPFDFAVVKGLPILKNEVAENAGKITSPWAIITKPGYSAYVLPATNHFPFFDKIYVYSGIVDYDDFHTINFVFTVTEPTELTIPAGTPIMQVIPFKREHITATYGKATQYECDRLHYGFYTRIKNTYRKLFMKQKKFTIEHV